MLKNKTKNIDLANSKINPETILKKLRAEAPIPEWRPHHDPIGELVLTLLSQNTSDTNSGRAYQQLLAKYKSWSDVISAPINELEQTIKIGGLAKTKARRMQLLLSKLRDVTGRDLNTDLLSSRLTTLNLEEAKKWLMELPGIGPKTAACVLLFAEGRSALPVDTHVFRVSQRLGLIPVKMSPAAAHTELESQLRREDFYAFHMALIRHGRNICKAQNPLCKCCPLEDSCPSASQA